MMLWVGVASAVLFSAAPVVGQTNEGTESEISQELRQLDCDQYTNLRRKCNKRSCKFNAKVEPKFCERLPQADYCEGKKSLTDRDKNKCFQDSRGSCKIVDGDCVPRLMPNTCRPCVGYPIEICGGFYTEGQCTADHLNDVQCNWVGFKEGMGCQTDWRPCSDEFFTNSKNCVQRSWGECAWDEETETCNDRTEFPDCQPCVGGGKCSLIFDKNTCKLFTEAGEGCTWKGWENGTLCSAKVNGYSCFLSGDPHIHGFLPELDTWDFMGIGEYWFLDSPAFKVHVRQQPTRSYKITSAVAISFFGPDFTCKMGTSTCSNTCGKTFELHIGHRVNAKTGAREGPEDFEPLLIVHDTDGSHLSWRGQDNIINAFLNEDLCDTMKISHESEDTITIEVYDRSTIKFAYWAHPSWGMTYIVYLMDKNEYDFFDPAIDNQYENAFCNLVCNPVDCGESMFTYYPNAIDAAHEEFEYHYAGRQANYDAVKGQNCETMERTECEVRPDPVGECEEELRQMAIDLCEPVCPKKTTKNCVFDACAAEDIQYALEYVETCQTIVTPIEPPVTSPTYEPTGAPTAKQCGVTIDPECQKNSFDCGGEGGLFEGAVKDYEPIFRFEMMNDNEGHNSCTCHQFCFMKGGSWFIHSLGPTKKGTTFTYDKKYKATEKEKKKNPCYRYIPAEVWTCTCYDDGFATGLNIDPADKKVKKSIKKGRKTKMAQYWAGKVSGAVLEI